MSELHRTIPFNKNPANTISLNFNTATSTAANAAVTSGATGAASSAAATTSTVGAFLATKAGIAIVSVVATVVVATAVVVPVVVTQTGGDDDPVVKDFSTYLADISNIPNIVTNQPDNQRATDIIQTTVPHAKESDEDDDDTEKEETDKKTSGGESGSGSGGESSESGSSGSGSGTNGESESSGGSGSGSGTSGESESSGGSGSGSGTSGESESSGGSGSGSGSSEESGSSGSGGETPAKTIVYYNSDMLSLTQNNFLECQSLVQVDRPASTDFKCEEINVKISYGGDNSAIDSKYQEILAENNKLIASSSTYDEIGSDGKLYLNGEYIGRNLYKHVFSDGLYGENPSSTEKAVKKVMKINPASSTNYVIGLYAPAGEVVKVEISQDDLTNIGGSLPFIIGFVTHNNVVSVNSESVGIKRVPNLSNTLVIKKTTGYIGSFLGGPIYINNPPKTKPFTITITGALPYKHLIFGVTTKKDFEAMKDYTAPFFELDIRDSIRYSGGLSNIKNLDYDSLILNLIFWDKCLRTSRQVPSGSNINLGIHFLFDPCVNSKGALALAYVGRNWCQVPPSFSMALNFETATKYGAWGHIHELNHHFQKYGFNSVSNEVTNNVINIVEYILYTQLSGLRNVYSTAALLKISGNHNYMNPEYSLNSLVTNPPSAADEIRFYEPIIQAFGPHLFLKATSYAGGKAGVDIFYESLVKEIHYDFTYYIEKVLNLVISESKKIEMQALNYPVFVPVTTVFQTGRYFTFNGEECFSNTSFPYRIPRGGATKLDFESHLIYPSGFTATIESISNPTYGTLKKESAKVYTYTPHATEKLSGRMKMVVHLVNTDEKIDQRIILGLEFEVDNSQSVQTNYIFDSVIYTDLDEAINKNFAGYSSYEFFPNFAGAMTGIKEGNVGIWEGKFRIDDDGYKYILYRGGRGPSKLFAKINSETEYKQIGYITINQGSYMFAPPSYAYYEHDFKKGDIVYFKAYLLGSTIVGSGTASLYIGISKENVVSKVRTLGANDIVGLDSEFDVTYKFDSGDPYYKEKTFDSLSFFDYSLVSISSPNFESWDLSATNGLEKLIDRNTNTYLHTRKNKAINANNPLTIIFDLGRVYSYDYIYFVRRTPNNYAPRTLTLSYSDDNITYTEFGEVTTEDNGVLTEMNLSSKLTSRYVKMHITKTSSPNPGYIALVSVEFIEKGINYALKNPEFVHIGYYKGEESNVQVNFNNFPYFGHSYILKKDTFMKFTIENTTGIRIKTCHKTASTIDYNVTQGETVKKSGTITIAATDTDDFPVIINTLEKGNYDFKFDVVDGSFDLEYILYEK